MHFEGRESRGAGVEELESPLTLKSCAFSLGIPDASLEPGPPPYLLGCVLTPAHTSPATFGAGGGVPVSSQPAGRTTGARGRGGAGWSVCG